MGLPALLAETRPFRAPPAHLAFRCHRKLWPLHTADLVHLACSRSPSFPLFRLLQGTTAHVYENRTCHSNRHLWLHTAEDQKPLFLPLIAVTGLYKQRLVSPSAVPRTSKTVMSLGLVLSSDVKQSGQGLPKRGESRELLPLQGQLVCNTSLNCSNTEPCL